jgi:Helix-turn-helix family
VHPARRLWSLTEPYHAVIYFSPEPRAAFEAAGLRGFWRGYFAGRAAPLGAVDAAPVTACFYGFSPAFVARALPSVWSLTTPARTLEARLEGADTALHRLVDVDALHDTIDEAAALLVDALRACDLAGRPLYAGNAGLPWPADPVPRLWHATTLLREHRGDGHVAALLTAGLDPSEAHVTQVAATGVTVDTIQPYRGWTDEDWDAATRRLVARGWMTDDGQLSADGRAGRDAVEKTTDRLAAAPVERLGPDRLARLFALLEPIVTALVEAGELPYPNPIGVPRPF